MNYHSLNVLVIFSFVVSLKAEFWCSRGYSPQECLPDGSGYIEYDCDQTEEKYVEVKDKFHKCPKEKSACKCFVNYNTEEQSEQACECVSAQKRPSFPSTGVIRWNGSYVFDNDYIKPWSAAFPGEIHKDSHGRYLMKRTSPVSRSKYDKPSMVVVDFEIILPHVNTGKSIKYTGDIRSKQCKIEEVKEEGDLTSIWKDDAKKYYNLDKEIPKSKDIVTQIWIQDIPQDYEGEKWKFTMDYDTVNDYAIPVSYNYEFHDNWDGITTSINLNYSYEPIAEEDESFKLEDYCSNV